MNFEAYHGVNGAQHQANFNKLSPQGYRMISLSVYGDVLRRDKRPIISNCVTRDFRGLRGIQDKVSWFQSDPHV